MKKTTFLTLISMLVLIFSCKENETIAGQNNKFKGISNEIILEWNVIAFEAMGGATYPNPMVASRVNAIVHIAIHDAINAITPNYSTYAFKGSDKKADPIAAIASAAHAVLLNQIPEKKDYLDGELVKYLNKLKESDFKKRGIALGKAAAQAILDLRSADPANESPLGAIDNPKLPGVYQPIPPVNFVSAPHWATLKPFAFDKSDQFRSASLPELTSEKYAQAYKEVKDFGRADSKVRTAEQTIYAKFWYEFSEMGWNRVARVAVANKSLDVVEAARLFALLNMALADSYIAGFESKYHYNFWRPWTAIHEATTDGNESTEADASWESLMPTPPVHDYPSTHSVLGNAGATVLARLLGDNTSFTMPSTTADPANPTRTFTSFTKAADENADSRVMAGIHFRFSCEAGQLMGNKIGNWTVDKHLLPVTKYN